MIIVTGTKRSGTSMWMQVLKAAGFPVIGAEFLGRWEETIRDANRRGFYETPLRRGIFYATNPHPETGAFLPPGRQTAAIAIKVFIPGVVRSDLAYLNRVIATMRHWREYAASLRRLHSMEREAFAKEGKAHQSMWLPPIIEWWLENFLLVRDVATRGYPLHLVTYDRMLNAPRETLAPVLKWLGQGDLDAAVAAVSASERTQHREGAGRTSADGSLEEIAAAHGDADGSLEEIAAAQGAGSLEEIAAAHGDADGSLEEIAAAHGDVFDALYARAQAGVPLDTSFIQRLNETHLALLPTIQEAQREVLKSRVRARQAARASELNPDVVELLVHGPEGEASAVPGAREPEDEFRVDDGAPAVD